MSNNSAKKRVILGFSGGVDSSLAALLCKRQGFSVLGVYLKSDLARDESEAAAAAAEQLGIEFRCKDITSRLEERVCAPFVREYLAGRTPNPCVVCNEQVKFPALAEYEGELVATGHYARAEFCEALRRRAIFSNGTENDQSYMLCRLPRGITERLYFPLGEMSKSQVRELAAEAGLVSAEKPDSMEICFIPDGDRRAFIAARTELPATAGVFTDGDGKVLGRHDGVHNYTVGQRKHLGIALGYPVYVADIDPASGRITLLPAGGEYAQKALLRDCVWHEATADGTEVLARVRHSRGFTRANLSGTANPDGSAQLCFPEGVRAPAPGQTAAVYIETEQGRALLGGGFIARA